MSCHVLTMCFIFLCQGNFLGYHLEWFLCRKHNLKLDNETSNDQDSR